jgi:hypothetical protein
MMIIVFNKIVYGTDHHNEYFKMIIYDWGILYTDLGRTYLISLLACAVLCGQLKCSTFVVLPEVALFICQMSKKKGTCMEKEEAFGHNGARMYQKTVKILHLNCILINYFSKGVHFSK